MIQIIPPVDHVTGGHLRAVMESAQAEGAPAPPRVVVEDDRGEWLRSAAAVGPTERGRSVVAVRTAEGLVAAVRLGIGGALWLPPSTQRAAAACRAAAAVDAIDIAPDAWLAELAAAQDRNLVAVSFANRSFWRCQMGEPHMTALLHALAVELAEFPAILPWPVLLLPDIASDEIHRAWSTITAEAGWTTQGLDVVPCDRREGHCGVVTAALRALIEHGDEPIEDSIQGFPRPVYALPSGNLVGWWGPPNTQFAGSREGWTALPESVSDVGYDWRLDGVSDGPDVAVDLLEVVGSHHVPRIPGWVAMAVGEGRPAGLLVEHMAEGAVRAGIPLWVPNVDTSRLGFLLRLPDTLWVDGPGVPDQPTA